MRVTLKQLGYTEKSIVKAIQRFIDEQGTHDDERISVAKKDLSLLKKIMSLGKEKGGFDLDTAETLVWWSVTSSDECCLDNREDYEPWEVALATRKMNKLNKALEIINNLKNQ